MVLKNISPGCLVRASIFKTENQFSLPQEDQMQYLVYLFTGHITTGSWEGRGNQYIQLVKVLYCKLPSISKQLPAFLIEVGLGTELRSQRWEARLLPLCHRGPLQYLDLLVKIVTGLTCN